MSLIISNVLSKTSFKFGICSGGITSYEFACRRIPFAMVCQVKHQLITAREWERKGIASNMGIINKKTKKKIEIFLKSILENKIPKQRKIKFLPDGLGSKRVAREIQGLK